MKNTYEQKAYFVSDSNNRVFTVYADTLDNKMMKRHGNRLMYSPGQYTAVYFYEERSAASVDLSVVSGFEPACGGSLAAGLCGPLYTLPRWQGENH